MQSLIKSLLPKQRLMVAPTKKKVLPVGAHEATLENPRQERGN
jgi:hypothetical protein